MNKEHIMKSLIIWITALFIFSSASPTIGYDVDIKKPTSDKTINEIDFLDKYNKYDVSELLPEECYPEGLPNIEETTPSFIESEQEELSAVSMTAPMDSAWPMY